MLNDFKVTANVPAMDLDRARRFYADMLGLTPADENPGGLVHHQRRDHLLRIPNSAGDHGRVAATRALPALRLATSCAPMAPDVGRGASGIQMCHSLRGVMTGATER